jgi:hypothetical protein
MILIYPAGLARSPYHLFRDKVPLTYPTRFSVGYSGYFVSLTLRHTVLHTDDNTYISDFINVVVNTSIHYLSL